MCAVLHMLDLFVMVVSLRGEVLVLLFALHNSVQCFSFSVPSKNDVLHVSVMLDSDGRSLTMSVLGSTLLWKMIL